MALGLGCRSAQAWPSEAPGPSSREAPVSLRVSVEVVPLVLYRLAIRLRWLSPTLGV